MGRSKVTSLGATNKALRTSRSRSTGRKFITVVAMVLSQGGENE
jgi:hypothetical protein